MSWLYSRKMVEQQSEQLAGNESCGTLKTAQQTVGQETQKDQRKVCVSLHCLLGLVEEYLADSCSAGAQFAQLSTNPTPQGYWSHGKTMDLSRLSRFGMTFEPLTDDHGEELLTWFLAVSRAKTYPQREKETALPVRVLDSGWKWRESSVKYDPDTRLWKTRQCSLLEDSEWFSETWPRWGLMRDGESWELPMSARPTYVRGSGLWRTPRASDWKGGITGVGGSKRAECDYFLPDQCNMLGRRDLEKSPGFRERMMGWPDMWTDLKPLETDKSRNALQKRGES